MEGLTKHEQKKVRIAMRDRGLTVTGWARSRGFAIDTVKSALYKGWGRGTVGPQTEKIIAKIREEGLA